MRGSAAPAGWPRRGGHGHPAGIRAGIRAGGFGRPEPIGQRRREVFRRGRGFRGLSGLGPVQEVERGVQIEGGVHHASLPAIRARRLSPQTSVRPATLRSRSLPSLASL